MDPQTPEALLAIWDKQLASLSDLAMENGVTPRGKIGSYDATRRFAEALILCGSQDAAADCFKQDIDGALAFLWMAYEVDRFLHDTEKPMLLPIPPAPPLNPFYVICGAVIDVINQTEKDDPYP